MLKNYKELTVRQKSYKLCLEIYLITAKFSQEERFGLTSQIRRADKVFRIQTLDPLTPGIPGPSSPAKLEKNQFLVFYENIKKLGLIFLYKNIK